MSRSRAVCSFVAMLVGGCVHYGGAQNFNTVAVTANVQAPAPPGIVLQNVPDIPTVGTRLDAPTIQNALDPYGTWENDATYGTIWYPNEQYVGDGFIPYGTQGNWMPTDSGWFWQSELPFGWVTFHYGRWVSVEQRWAWVPGALFAPAWVDWRSGGGWVGWAPLPPYGAAFDAPYAFCEMGYLGASDFWSRTYYGQSAVSLYSMTTAMPVTYGFGGAVYAWGPPATGTAVANPMPLATAWGGETARARTPSRGGVATAQPPGPGGGIPTAQPPAHGGGLATAQPPGTAMNRTPPVGGATAWPVGPGERPDPRVALSRSGVAPPPYTALPQPTHMPSAPITSLGPSPEGERIGRVNEPVMRQTVSLGSVGGVERGWGTESVVAPGGSRSGVVAPVVRTMSSYYSTPQRSGYTAPAAVRYEGGYGGGYSGGYGGGATYSAPHYASPVGGGYAAPHYGAPMGGSSHTTYTGGHGGGRR